MLLFTNPIMFHPKKKGVQEGEKVPSPDPHGSPVIVVAMMIYQPADLEEEPQPPVAVVHTVSVSTH